MKMVIAFVQPFMAGDVLHALHQVSGVTGATFTDVRGFGRDRHTDAALPEALFGAAAKVRVEVMVRDEYEDAVVRAIHGAARTGKRGDGKIYVAPVTRALRIATGEEGEAAV